MSKSVPVVKLTNPDRTVRFNYGCIARVEDELGLTTAALFDRFREFNALPPEEAVKPKAERRAATPEELAAAGKRLSVGLVSKFVAACIGVTLDDLCDLVPPDRLFEVFSELSNGLGQAIDSFNSEDAPHPSDTQAASAGAQPGHESNATSEANSPT